MLIPKSFKLFATKIDVVFDNVFCNSVKCYGLADYTESKIYMSSLDGVKALAEDTVVDTFYHEKIHIILDSMGEKDLSSNEKFVEVFAKLLRQSDETAEYHK